MSELFNSFDNFSSDDIYSYVSNPFQSPIQVTTTSHNIENYIKQMNQFQYGHKHKEQNYANQNEDFSLLFDINTITKTTTIKELEEEKYKREDNCRRMIGRDIFNHYFKHKIEGYIRNNNLILCFENFPKEFIFKVTNKGSISYLNKPIEELILDKELYNDTKPNNNYEKNLKAIKAIKNKNENNFDDFLQKTYRELIEDYLSSKEYKQKKEKLEKKKGINEAKRYESFCKIFIENFND